MVSVVIPTFNRAGMVAEAIQSVLQQTRSPIEIIVVDDGSGRATREALHSFGRKIVVLHQERKGVSAARNAGIGKAKGDWLALLDSDDLWLPTKLEVQMRFLEHTPGTLVCQTQELWLRNGKRWNPKKYHKKPRGNCFEHLLERCLISPSAVLIHRSVLDRVGGFDESLPACEDYDLWLRIGCRYPVGLIDEPLVVKRGGHPDQLSSTVPTLDRYRIRALVKILLSGSLTPRQQALTFHVLRKKCRIYGTGCQKRGNLQLAERILALPRELSLQLRQEPFPASWSCSGRSRLPSLLE